MEMWKAHYKDEKHDTDIEILSKPENSAETLSFEIDGVKFSSCTSLCEFECDSSLYDKIKDKFNLLRWGKCEAYSVVLQRYTLSVEIPVKIVWKRDNSEITGHIYFSYTLSEDTEKRGAGARVYYGDTRVYPDRCEVLDVALRADGEEYRPKKIGSTYFENILNGISEIIGQKYYLKCCFTCQYSDYSPYGNDDYGTMLCFRENKEDCLKVNKKAEYFEYLDEKKSHCVQETYICSEYAIRNRAEGYRGYVRGVDKE